MKKFVFLITFVFTLNVNSQIDLSCDASFIGVNANIQVSYPIKDVFIVGGSYGYNFTNYLLSDRIDLVLGWKPNEWIQLEGNFGILTGYNYQHDKMLRENKTAFFHYDIGIKGHFCNNLFYTLSVAQPGFVKVGFGVRLRPYKKLTLWDKQF